MEKSLQLLREIVKAMVKNPEQVFAEGKADEMGVLLTLIVAKEDMGLVVGKEGMNAKALRTLMKSVGRAQGARVSLKIAEPEGSQQQEQDSNDSF